MMFIKEIWKAFAPCGPSGDMLKDGLSAWYLAHGETYPSRRGSRCRVTRNKLSWRCEALSQKQRGDPRLLFYPLTFVRESGLDE